MVFAKRLIKLPSFSFSCYLRSYDVSSLVQGLMFSGQIHTCSISLSITGMKLGYKNVVYLYLCL